MSKTKIIRPVDVDQHSALKERVEILELNYEKLLSTVQTLAEESMRSKGENNG